MTYESIYRQGLFDGKVAIVTGGGSGLGRCTARAPNARYCWNPPPPA